MSFPEAMKEYSSCGLASVITKDGDVYGRIVPEDIPDILIKY